MTLSRIRIASCITFVCIIVSVACYAQSSTVSPYSRYGIGDLQNQYGAQSFSMGQTGTALHNDSLMSPYFINLKNPASYFYNRITTFEAGVLNNNMRLETEGQMHNNSNTYFGYFAIAFPIGNHFGGSFGLRPMSSVGYNINTTGSIDSSGTSIGTTTNQYVGSGGINQLHVGVAYSPIRNLSLGLNASYLFGNITNTDNVIYSPNMLAYNSQRTENVNIHGFALDYGIMYTIGKTRDSSWQVVLGATASAGNSLNANYNLLAVNYIIGAPQANLDTLQDSSATGKIKLPLSLGGGITFIKRDKYNNDMWTFSVDYTMQNWSQYSYFGQTQNLTDSKQLGVGIQYIPNKNGFDVQKTSYFSRIYYRLGFCYNQTYLDLNNTPLNDYSVSFGIAMPIGPNIPMLRASILNLGIQLGQFGTTANNLLQEQYLKFMVGLTFNDRWFIKRKYE